MCNLIGGQLMMSHQSTNHIKIYWKGKSAARWLAQGQLNKQTNTRYYHSEKAMKIKCMSNYLFVREGCMLIALMNIYQYEVISDKFYLSKQEKV